jgi:hypothetical protein
MKEDEMDESCSTRGEIRYVYKIWVDKSEGKRPFGRSRRIWKDNIRRDLK